MAVIALQPQIRIPVGGVANSLDPPGTGRPKLHQQNDMRQRPDRPIEDFTIQYIAGQMISNESAFGAVQDALRALLDGHVTGQARRERGNA